MLHGAGKMTQVVRTWVQWSSHVKSERDDGMCLEFLCWGGRDRKIDPQGSRTSCPRLLSRKCVKKKWWMAYEEWQQRLLSSLHTCTLTCTEKHTPITTERSTILTAYTMSHAEDSSSVPGMYVWRLLTTCKQLQQIQLLVMASSGTCCTCMAYTHIDANTYMQIKQENPLKAHTYMQIKQQENPPKSTSQKAVWRAFVGGAVSMGSPELLSHIIIYLCFLWSPPKEKAPILLCCGLSSWTTSESSASRGVRTICLQFLGVGTTATGKQALLPCLWGVTGGNWQFPSQPSTHLKSFSLSFQESLQSKIQLKSMRQERTGYPQCQTRRGLLSKNPLAHDGKAHREYSSC